MDIKNFTQLLKTKLPESIIYVDELMNKYTTFRIGGKADLMIKPTTIDELRTAITLCKTHEVPYYILGNGSNLLVADEGYRGVIIQVYSNLSEIKIEGNKVTAMAGALLAKVATAAADQSLTGFEFAHGIPGTIGGAIVMNAGAYDGEMKQVVESVEVIDAQGNLLKLSKEDLKLGYRSSILQHEDYVAVMVTLQLAEGDQEAIKAKMKDFAGRRRDKQPLDKPSAGSTFKRPEGYFAGKLIMDSGLRGFQMGGAQVSEKHCGFIINSGDATCKDVENLIAHVQKVVEEKYGVRLETEVKRLK